MSLSPNWRQDFGNDEVELFLDKYVLPMEKKCPTETSSEHDSGLHSLETTSASSSQRKSKAKNNRRLVTIVKINGETSTFRTLSTKCTDRTLKITRSKTLPSYHKQKLLLTVNGCDSNQIF